MSAEQLAARILSEAAEVPSEQIRRGDMTEPEFRRFVDAACIHTGRYDIPAIGFL